MLREGLYRCPRCGAELVISGPPPGAMVTQAIQTLRCPVCGAALGQVPTGGWSVSVSSGESTRAPVAGSQETSPPGGAASPGERFARMATVLAPFVLGGAAIGALAAHDKTKGALLGAAYAVPAVFAAGWAGFALGFGGDPQAHQAEGWAIIAGLAGLEVGLIKLLRV